MGVGDVMAVFEYVPCGDICFLGVQVKCDPPKPTPWTLAPLQFCDAHGYRPLLSRANTAITNLGDASHQTLLGENETDEYVEERMDPMDRLSRGVKGAWAKAFPNPFAMATLFMAAAAPDNILIVMEEQVSPKVAVSRERR